jgi:hypothetical protein
MLMKQRKESEDGVVRRGAVGYVGMHKEIYI